MKLIVATLLLLARFNAHGETLVAPSFPSPSAWTLAATAPLNGADTSAGEIKLYRPVAEDKDDPKNIVSIITVAKIPPNTGAVEYLTMVAQGWQAHCENMRTTRPALQLEKHVPVAYARIYCAKEKTANSGMIETVKVLQGKHVLYVVERRWHTPAFDFQVGPAASEQFANRVFSSPAAATNWIAEFNEANNFVATKVSLCAMGDDEFGDSCTGQ